MRGDILTYELIDLYRAGYSTVDLANRFNTHWSTIRLRLKGAGEPLRTAGESNSLAKRSGIKKPSNGYKSRGYKFVLKDQRKYRYTREHPLVWEEKHKRKLPRGYIVHHLNGIKDDNRPGNLVALKRGEHLRIHKNNHYQTRIRELENEIKILRQRGFFQWNH